jgi:hypothetical protein
MNPTYAQQVEYQEYLNTKKKKTYSKQLEADNIRDYNSKIKDHNVFIKLKQIHLIDIKHFLN